MQLEQITHAEILRYAYAHLLRQMTAYGSQEEIPEELINKAVMIKALHLAETGKDIGE